VAAAVIGWYALRVGSLLLIAHAAELGLVAAAAWAAFDAAHVRKLYRELENAERGVPAESKEPQSAVHDHPSADDDTARMAKRMERQRRRIAEAKSLHMIYLAVPVAAIAFFALFQGWRLNVTPGEGVPASIQATLGLTAVATSIVWLILANTLGAVRGEDVPEATALALTFRELQWSSWLVAGSLLAGAAVPNLPLWAGRGLCLWVLALGVEQLLRTGWGWIEPEAMPDSGSGTASEARTHAPSFASPINLLLREAFLVRANPLASLFDVLETRFGVNFRASWAINFVRRVTVPLLVLLVVLGWLVTIFQVVEPHQLAVEERLGRAIPEPRGPGLHVTLPWPLAEMRRYPVKTVQVMQIGFKDSGQASRGPLGDDSPRALLWTKAHEEEFALVLGSETEMVSVNALVYYKIQDSKEGFFNYVYHTQNAETAMEALAYRVLLESTRSATLNRILSANRAGFAERFRDRLREYVARERLGIEVVDVAIVNLHPPVQVAADYLDVIGANLDALRVEQEAIGYRGTRLLEAAAESQGLTASAKIQAARRVALASAESNEFSAADTARRVSPTTYDTRLWIEALEQSLHRKRLFLVEQSLLDRSDNVWLDLRPESSRTIDLDPQLKN
jgi:regulator of protease activity HflC (stomatin/prohibitin superfamily)